MTKKDVINRREYLFSKDNFRKKFPIAKNKNQKKINKFLIFGNNETMREERKKNR